jgi:hypothetical protein
MRPFAPRALARFGQAHPITKNVPAFQALGSFDQQSLLLENKGALDMREVVIDLSFADSEGHGEVPCGMFFRGKVCYHLLSNGLHIKNMIVFSLFPVSVPHLFQPFPI